jgi:hypothetical protein
VTIRDDDPAPEPDPEPAPDPDPTSDPDPEPTPDPDPMPEPVPEPTPDPEPEPTPAPDPDPAPVPDPQPTPGPEPDPTPQPEPDPEPIPEPPPPAPEPLPTLTLDDITIDEGAGAAVVPARLSKPPKLFTAFAWHTADGSAASPADYVPSSGLVAFASGDTTGRLPIPIVDDDLDEPDETFTVRLTIDNGFDWTPRAYTVTIRDDDDPPPAPEPDPEPAPVEPAPAPVEPTVAATEEPVLTELPAGTAPDPEPLRGPRLPDRRRCVDDRPPSSSFRPNRHPIHANRSGLRFRGISWDRGCGALDRVTIAIARREGGGTGLCRYLQPSGRLGRIVTCRQPTYVKVHGTTAWSFALDRRLLAGTWTARIRAHDRAGNFEKKVRKAAPRSRNFVTFKVR